MANNFYGAVALTGGAPGALDAINGSILNDGDGAVVIVGNQGYLYSLDADSAAAESSPDVISPDSSAGDKRWILSNTLNTMSPRTYAGEESITHENGMIEKFGTAAVGPSGTTVTFGTPFPNEIIAVNLTIEYSSWANHYTPILISPTVNSFTIGIGNISRTVHWSAKGR